MIDFFYATVAAISIWVTSLLTEHLKRPISDLVRLRTLTCIDDQIRSGAGDRCFDIGGHCPGSSRLAAPQTAVATAGWSDRSCGGLPVGALQTRLIPGRKQKSRIRWHLEPRKQLTVRYSLFTFSFDPMDDAKFGFSAFAEQWNGRLAMMGFIIGVGTELLTGQGILSQIGIG